MWDLARGSQFIYITTSKIYPFKSRQKPVFCNFYLAKILISSGQNTTVKTHRCLHQKWKLVLAMKYSFLGICQCFFPVYGWTLLRFFFPKTVILNTSVFCGGFMCFGVYLSLNLVNCNSIVKERVHSLVY